MNMKDCSQLLWLGGVIARTMADGQVFAVSLRDLNLDPPEVGVGQTLLGIVGEQVLRAQLLGNLLKGAIELRSGSCVVVLAAGVVRKLNERVFAASVASRAGFYGHDDDAVQNRLGLLGAAQRFLITDTAGGVAAIGDNHQHFASLALLQSLRAKINSVV